MRVEADPDVRHVGLGGDPNLAGDVECDAAVMDGTTLAAGAVGALRDCVHAVSVARAVMERLPHVMLVGEGAARVAREVGQSPAQMLTDAARDAYRTWTQTVVAPADRNRWPDIATAEHAWAAARRKEVRDTVIFLAIDREGNIAAATSTSGISYKYPGRLGDSPVIGAGLYAHSRHGACGCTHTGEVAIRASTAVSVVRSMQRGTGVRTACLEALRDIAELKGGNLGPVAIHALDREGMPCVMCTPDMSHPPSFWIWRGDGHDVRRGRAERGPETPPRGGA